MRKTARNKAKAVNTMPITNAYGRSCGLKTNAAATKKILPLRPRIVHATILASRNRMDRGVRGGPTSPGGGGTGCIDGYNAKPVLQCEHSAVWS